MYPHFLLADACSDELNMVRYARRVNDSMAEYAVERLTQQVGDIAGRRVLILGLAYRAGSKKPVTVRLC